MELNRKLPLASHMPGRALARLILGERLTHRSFDRATHSYRLSSPIEVLRNKCRWPVDDLWREEKTGDGSRRARFKEYYLSQEIIETITPEEREFARKVIESEGKG